MRRIILIAFLILILFPISSGFSQTTDTQPTLSVVLTSKQPFVYTDSEGYTVVVGEVENQNALTAVTDVRIKASFFNEQNSELLEVVRDGPVMDVIPPNGKSPYIIKSNTANPAITSASVMMEGFNSSPSKSKQLVVEATNVLLDETLQFSGILTNNGGAPIADAQVVAVFYDGFEPPRIVGVSTIDVGSVDADGVADFSFNEKIDARIVSFNLFADSDVFYSDSVNMEIPQPETTTRLVTISDVTVIDNDNSKTSQIVKGSTVKIQSGASIQFSTDQESFELPYTYYVQVKQSVQESNETVTYVEYLGTHDGSFLGAGKEFPSVEWTPQKTGIFFIETFVWDSLGTPIANKGPITLVIVI